MFEYNYDAVKRALETALNCLALYYIYENCCQTHPWRREGYVIDFVTFLRLITMLSTEDY